MLEQIDIKGPSYYYSNNLVNINDSILWNIKLDKNSYLDCLTCYIGYETSHGVKNHCIISFIKQIDKSIMMIPWWN